MLGRGSGAPPVPRPGDSGLAGGQQVRGCSTPTPPSPPAPKHPLRSRPSYRGIPGARRVMLGTGSASAVCPSFVLWG